VIRDFSPRNINEIRLQMPKVKFCFANVSCLKNHNLDRKANYSKLQVKALSLSYFMEYTNISSEIRVFLYFRAA